MKVTYLGTTMLLFDDGKDQILFDCHVTRPSFFEFLFKRVKTDSSIADRVLQDFPMNRVRAMFISHSHSDHAMDVPYFANRCHCIVYGSKSTLNIARGGNVSEEKLQLFTHNQVISIGNFKITVLNSIHSKPSLLNNNLGQVIEEPLYQPTKVKNYKEGGSFDFFIEHDGRKYLIRPSYNLIPGQLDKLNADVLFLGIAGLAQDSLDHKAQFWAETVDKVKPKTVIPIHWDNFFSPLYGPLLNLPRKFEFTGKGMHELALECSKREINCLVQIPLSSIEI